VIQRTSKVLQLFFIFQNSCISKNFQSYKLYKLGRCFTKKCEFLILKLFCFQKLTPKKFKTGFYIKKYKNPVFTTEKKLANILSVTVYSMYLVYIFFCWRCILNVRFCENHIFLALLWFIAKRVVNHISKFD
jgi:hypothetical protein